MSLDKFIERAEKWEGERLIYTSFPEVNWAKVITALKEAKEEIKQHHCISRPCHWCQWLERWDAEFKDE